MDLQVASGAAERGNQRENPGAGGLERNVARPERVLSTLVGGALLAVAASRGRLTPVSAVAGVLGGSLTHRGVTGRCPVYRALGVNTAEGHSGGARVRGRSARALYGAPEHANEVQRSITIGRPAEELDRMFRDTRVVSRIMGHFAEVTGSGEHKHWRVSAPLGSSLEWDERLVEHRPGEFLRWESLPGAELPTEGWIRFQRAPADFGTEVTLQLRFDPPGGALTRSVIKRLGMVPDALTAMALRRFKSLAETGELPTTEPNPAARHGGSSY